MTKGKSLLQESPGPAQLFQDLHESTLNSSLAEILANLDCTSTPANRKGGDADDEEFFSSSLQEFLQDDPLAPLQLPPEESIKRSVLREPSFSASLKGFLVNRSATEEAENKSAGQCSPTSEVTSTSEAQELPDLVDGSVSVMHGSSKDLSQDLSSLEDSVNDQEDSETIGEVVDIREVKGNEVDQPIDHKALIASIELCNQSIEKRLAEWASSDALGTGCPPQAVGQTAKATNEGLVCMSPMSKQKEIIPSASVTVLSKDKPLTMREDTTVHQKSVAQLGRSAVEVSSSDPATVLHATQGQTEQKSSDDVAVLIPEIESTTSTLSLITGTSTDKLPLSPKRRHKSSNPAKDKTKLHKPSRRRVHDEDHATIEKAEAKCSQISSESFQLQPVPECEPRSETILLSPSRSRKSHKVKPTLEGSPKRTKKSSVKLCVSEPEKERHHTAASKDIEIAETSAKATTPDRTISDVGSFQDHKVSREEGNEKEEVYTNEELVATSKIEVDEAPKSAQPESVGVLGLAKALPSAKSPKSPRRELRLKIDLEEVRPSGEEDGQGISDAPDESLPHVLKMLLEGVARKIRKHARQDSSRKFQTPKVADEQLPPTVKESQDDAEGNGTLSTSPKQRIKVKVEKGSSSLTSPRIERRRRNVPENLTDFDPHDLNGSNITNEPSDQPTTPKRRERRSDGKRSAGNASSSSQASMSKKGHRTKTTNRSVTDWNPQAGPSQESVAVRRERRRNPDDDEKRSRERLGIRMVRGATEGSSEKHHSSHSSGSKSQTQIDRKSRRDDHSSPTRSVGTTNTKSRSSITSGESPRSTSKRKSYEGSVSLAAALEHTDTSNHRSRSVSSRSDHRSRHSGSRSVYSQDSRKRRDNQKSLSSTSDSNAQHRSTYSSSRSVCSRSSHNRHEKRRSGASSTQSRRNSHHSSPMDQSNIEYDFSDDPPLSYRSPTVDVRGRSVRRSGPAGGRSQSDRHLLKEEREFESTMRGRSQSHRHLLRSDRDLEFHPESRAPAKRSSSQPVRTNRHSRTESSRSASTERSGRSRSRPQTEGRRNSISSSASSGNAKSNRRSQSRPPDEERNRSNASTSSDRTPLRSGGRARSPHRYPHPTTVRVSTESSTACTHDGQVNGKSKVQRALSFRDLFAREPDPWQEFTSPVKVPRASMGAATSGSTRIRNMRFLPGMGNVRPASCRDLSASECAPDQFEPFAHFTSQLDLQTNGAAKDYPARTSPERKTAFHEPKTRTGNGWAPKLFR